MIKNIIYHILRVFISVVFLYSAYSKLYPAEPFELFVFSHGIFDWFNSTIIVRLLVAIELFIGVLLLINIYTKRILQLTILLFVAFTMYLLYIMFFAQEITDCMCFGDKFELTPLESIFKNVLFIGISIYLLIINKPFKLKYNKIILLFSIIITLALPFVLSPPDGFINTEYKNKITNRKIDSDVIGNFYHNNEQLSLKEGKAIVCFFSTGCKFCKMAAQKISISIKKENKDYPIYYVFYGNEINMQQFWDESKSIKFPYKVIPTEVFFSYSGSSLPSIMFIENEEIINHVGYRAIDDKMISNFFNN